MVGWLVGGGVFALSFGSFPFFDLYTLFLDSSRCFRTAAARRTYTPPVRIDKRELTVAACCCLCRNGVGGGWGGGGSISEMHRNLVFDLSSAHRLVTVSSINRRDDKHAIALEMSQHVVFRMDRLQSKV